jgi:uncharacterized protein (TIGR02246 family)
MLRYLIFGSLLMLLPIVAVGEEPELQKSKRGNLKSADSQKSEDKVNRDRAKQKKRVSSKAIDPQAKERQALVATIHSYVDAYNAGNSKAVAAHWSAKGVWVDHVTGDRITGADSLRKHFAAAFANDDRPRLSVNVVSIRFVADSVAVEEGVAQLVNAEGVSESGYTAIHVNEQGKWKVDSVREHASNDVTDSAPTSQYEYLRELEWMVGEWADKSEGSTIETSCKWTKNRNFLMKTFRVVVGEQVDLEGTQIIGWDPVNKTIRSWVFDSDGGFGQGVWTRKGDSRWVVRTAQTLSDGSTASSVNIFRHIDKDSFGWQSLGREVNGEFAPNIDEVKVSRIAAASTATE